jgi:hypothetical protein
MIIIRHYHILDKSSDSSVRIALEYGLDDRGSRFRFPAGTGNFFLHHRVPNGSGAHPASYPMGTRGSFPRGKAAGAWSWPLPSSVEVKNAWSYTSTPQYFFMAWCIVKHKETLPFTIPSITEKFNLLLLMLWILVGPVIETQDFAPRQCPNYCDCGLTLACSNSLCDRNYFTDNYTGRAVWL